MRMYCNKFSGTARRSKRMAVLAFVLVCMVCFAAFGEGVPFSYEIREGYAVITGIAGGFSGKLTIPESVEGYPVTCIGDYAFEDCTGLTSVELPSSLHAIGQSAFSGCTDLFDMAIPVGVIDIAQSAFEGCSGLTRVSL